MARPKKPFAYGEPRFEMVELGEIKKWSGNPKTHDLDFLGEAYATNGFAEFPTIDEGTGKMVAGHGRVEKLEAMKAAGEEPPARVQVREGKWFVPVVRGMIFPDPEKHLLASNRAAEKGGWDNGALAKFLSKMKNDFIGTGFGENDLVRFMAMSAAGPLGGKTDPDAVPDSAEQRSKLGDLWILGEHRLLCGDACLAKDVDRLMGKSKAVLMNTDPPYGIDYTANKDGIPRAGFKNIVERFGEISNDNLTPEKLRTLFDEFLALALARMSKTAAVYLWHPTGKLNEIFRAALEAVEILVHRNIVWAKPGFVLARSGMYHPAHEDAFYGWVKGNTPPWFGEKNQTSVWRLGRDDGKAVHPTQKPVALFEIPMLNHTAPGQICYEPFSGSGSQIIAGERLKRRVFAIDNTPRWVDTALTRWEAFTGKKAKLAKGT